MPKKIYIIAGEASGDLHGANLVKNLKKLSDDSLIIYGVGGDKMKEAGVLDFFDLAHFHVTGISKAIQKIPQYQKAAKTILASIARAKPDLVVFIDNPGFNLHLAEKLHALNTRLVYYITPQIWAWGGGRIKKIKKYFEKVFVVFDFEEKLFKEHGVPVSFVGHPLKDLMESYKTPDKKEGLIICLMPGSRTGEIESLLSVFLGAAKILSKKLPEARFYLIKSPTLPVTLYQKYLKKFKLPLTLIEKNSYDAIQQSRLAIVCSGTATLECALLGTPPLISNKGSLLTYVLAKNLIRVPYIGLPNIVLGEKKFPELLQFDASPEKIAETAYNMLTDQIWNASLRQDLQKISEKLGVPGANQKAAEEILKVLKDTSLVRSR